MWFSNKDKEAEPETVEAELISTKSAIHNLSFENGELVAKTSSASGSPNEEKIFTGEDLVKIVPPEKFHGAVVRGLNFVGRRKKLKSLQIDKANEDFQAACEVLYTRLSDSVAGPYLERLSNKAIEDGILIAMGFGPVAMACFNEVKDRKRHPLPTSKTEEEQTTKEAQKDG